MKAYWREPARTRMARAGVKSATDPDGAGWASVDAGVVRTYSWWVPVQWSVPAQPVPAPGYNLCQWLYAQTESVLLAGCNPLQYTHR